MLHKSKVFLDELSQCQLFDESLYEGISYMFEKRESHVNMRYGNKVMRQIL
jgi:hypothetical protein